MSMELFYSSDTLYDRKKGQSDENVRRGIDLWW